MKESESSPEVIQCPRELFATVQAYRRLDKRVGLVPTMGSLHDGHLSLVRRSCEECDATIVSIFVNPSQFGPDEDYDQYPRALDDDMKKLAGYGVRWVFAPAADDVYPNLFSTWVNVNGVSEPLEGENRPGHFRGVTTIVLKLFNMAGADVAYFGQKDYQQAAVIRRMTEDLNVPTEIVVCPTVREPDGLAMSSRNMYLNTRQRQQALVLHRGLELAQNLIGEGASDPGLVQRAITNLIMTADEAAIDYVALADPDTLLPAETITDRTLVTLAVRIGNTRLIDNALIER